MVRGRDGENGSFAGRWCGIERHWTARYITRHHEDALYMPCHVRYTMYQRNRRRRRWKFCYTSLIFNDCRTRYLIYIPIRDVQPPTFSIPPFQWIYIHPTAISNYNILTIYTSPPFAPYPFRTPLIASDQFGTAALGVGLGVLGIGGLDLGRIYRRPCLSVGFYSSWCGLVYYSLHNLSLW